MKQINWERWSRFTFLVTCDEAIFFFLGAQKKKSPDRRLPSSRSSISVSLKQNASCNATTSSQNDPRETGTSKTKWLVKATEKNRMIWPFLPSKWLSFQFCQFNFFYWSELIRVQFYFTFICLFVRVGPSRSGPTFVPVGVYIFLI